MVEADRWLTDRVAESVFDETRTSHSGSAYHNPDGHLSSRQRRQQGQVFRMAIKQGDSVTNSKCADWGTGVVLSIGPNSAKVRFPTIGAKRLLVDVLIRSSEPTTIVDEKGRKADPQYQARLRELVDTFSASDNGEGIPNIEAMIYEAFLVSGVGKGAIKRRLTQWMSANPRGRQEKGLTDAKALYDFLFPDNHREKKAT